MCKVAWSDAAREGVVVEHGAMGEGEIVQRGDGIYVRDNLPGLEMSGTQGRDLATDSAAAAPVARAECRRMCI